MHYSNPVKLLQTLVESLPNLVALDISGTNLAGLRMLKMNLIKLIFKNIFNFLDSGSGKISGLESRQSNPLQFLGIFHTNVDASYRAFIPAIKVCLN